MEWPGATIVQFRPSTEDGIGFIAYKVTGPTAGVWHYEYAIYNENLDRAISYFILPRSTSVNITNIGFHAPPQHPGYTFDGTPGNLGFSNTPWTTNIYDQAIVFGTEAFAQNPNANAIRWGTMYNVRFDSTSAPVTTSATVGFFKTGSPIAVQVMGPSAVQGPPPCTGRRITGVPSPGCGGL